MTKFLLAIGFIVPLGLNAADAHRITVEAGDVARDNSVVTVAVPASGPPGDWELLDAKGARVPVQVTPQGELAFLLRTLAAGSKAQYRLQRGAPAGGPPKAKVTFTRADGKIHARVGDATLFSFQEAPSRRPDPTIPEYYERGGYLHPVYSPSGTVVTGDYRPDHYHHHGIWFAWVKTEYEGRHPDFWNVQDKLGRLDFKGVESVWSGAVHGGLTARFHSIDILAPQPKPVVDDLWEVRAYPVEGGERRYWMFDLHSTQRIIGPSALMLPAYRYGGIGIRGNAQWDGEGDKTRFLTSTGEKDRIKAHESRAVWCHMGGLVDGKLTGIATLSHPTNFRSPEPMRVNPKIPFLNFAPSQAGDWEMAPGKTYVWRYRFIVQDGEPDKDWLDRKWADYAKPAKVTVERM